MAENSKHLWLEEAMARYEVSLLRVCFACLGDAALAEDALQETFLKAWKAYDRFRWDADDKTWLTRIAINTCRNMRKTAWYCRTISVQDPEQMLEASRALPPSSDLLRDDSITLAVLALPISLREAVLLRWYQGYSGEEAARALGIPRSTLYYRLRRAQQLLKKDLEDWYYETE